MLGPRNMDSISDFTNLQHQRSTRQLISQYESMSPSQISRSSSRADHGGPLALPRPTLPSHKKDKSPLRQSFRNLFSVFKKTNTLGKGKLDDGGPPLSNYRKESLPIVLDTPGMSAPPVLRSRSRQMTSSLLYLSRIPSLSNSILPVWTTCTVTLESDRIVISWLTPHGNPSTHSIPLSHCSDVRSLSLQQLDHDEAALLPKGATEDLKLFEILFEGKAREKFAATSVRERAGWVSAIWDAVLPSQDPNSKREVTNGSSNIPAKIGSLVPNPRPMAVTSYSERSLPPIPREARPNLLSLNTLSMDANTRIGSLSPISPSVYPPTRPVSRASSGVDSRCKSPSIANLGQLSVVRQRLAQIEHNSSQSSYGGLTSPTSSQASYSTRLTTPVLDSEKGASILGRNESQDMSRVQSMQSSAAGSLIIEKTLSSSSRPESRAMSRLQSVQSSPVGFTLEKGPSTFSRHESQNMTRVQSMQSSAADSILDAYGDVDGNKPPQSTASETIGPKPVRWSRQLSPLPERDRRPQSVVPNSRLEPFAELLHDHAAKNYDQTANLGDQIISLQSDVQRLPHDVTAAIGMDIHSKAMRKMISKVDKRVESNRETLKDIHSKIEHLAKRSDSPGDANILEELQLIRQHLETDSKVRTAAKLEELGKPVTTTFANLASSGTTFTTPTPNFTSAVDLSAVHAKLDDFLAVYRVASAEKVMPSRIDAPVQPKIVALLEEDKAQRTLQAQQQADSVRYLNELNSWLETFVNHGTSQIQDLCAGVNQLCQDFGSVEGGNSILADIRQLALSTSARDQSSVALQASMDDMLAMIHEQSVSSNIASIAGLIDRQRQDQEGLIRALTTEISDEIKGERLRFVEAMKEATAINVQIHVEQFKKELKREVIGMTQEVGRLHQDRQAMQNQIADLFAFYTKQKAAAETQPRVPVQDTSYEIVEHRRPLPQPRRQ